MPTETSGLGPLKKKRIIMKDVVDKRTCSGMFEQVHGGVLHKCTNILTCVPKNVFITANSLPNFD